MKGSFLKSGVRVLLLVAVLLVPLISYPPAADAQCRLFNRGQKWTPVRNLFQRVQQQRPGLLIPKLVRTNRTYSSSSTMVVEVGSVSTAQFSTAQVGDPYRNFTAEEANEWLDACEDGRCPFPQTSLDPEEPPKSALQRSILIPREKSQETTESLVLGQFEQDMGEPSGFFVALNRAVKGQPEPEVRSEVVRFDRLAEKPPGFLLAGL